MIKAFPFDLDNALAEVLDKAVNSYSKLEYNSIYFSQMEFIYNIESLPRSICLLKFSEDEIYPTCLNYKLVSKFSRGLGIGHFPVIHPRKIFKIISAENEDVTNLYLLNRERYKIQEFQADLIGPKNSLFLVQTKLQYKNIPFNYLWKETIVDRNEDIIYSSVFPFKLIEPIKDGFKIVFPNYTQKIEMHVIFSGDLTLIRFNTNFSYTLRCLLDKIEAIFPSNYNFYERPLYLKIYFLQGTLLNSEEEIKDFSSEDFIYSYDLLDLDRISKSFNKLKDVTKEIIKEFKEFRGKQFLSRLKGEEL